MLRIVLLGALMCLVSGCGVFSELPEYGGAEGVTDEKDAGVDAGVDAVADADADVDVDAADADRTDDVDVSQDADTCVPIAVECSVGQCGLVDDGCGGVVDCGPCPCQEGVAAEASCGVCGLGKIRCAPEETGPGTCDEPQIPGLSAQVDLRICAETLIFVDAGNATETALRDGSADTPFKTYAEAREAAESGQTIILAGTQPFGEPLVLKNGVSVFGGFASGPAYTWNADAPARFEVPVREPDEPVFGIKADRIIEDTHLANIVLITHDAPVGQTNYGAYVRDSDALTFRAVDIRAGRGGEGGDGRDGDKGASGENGQDGVDGQIMTISGRPPSPQFGAKGGKNSGCDVPDGGAGGSGSGVAGSQAYLPTDGASVLDAEGGAAGIPSRPRGRQAGKAGDDGARVSGSGRYGRGGSPGGALIDDQWAPEGAGEPGGIGKHGRSGAGGGGSVHGEMPLDDGFGSAGAGGGAGGCGGEGGEGGQPGGGAFGLFLVRSDVRTIDSSFIAGQGGAGGDGGSPGLGGEGGQGGRGSNVGRRRSGAGSQWESYLLLVSSGDGGDGSAGTAGGYGGGGAGGSSFGAFCAEDSRIQEEGEVTIKSAATPAEGGRGGGNSGRPGLVEDRRHCE